MMTMVPAAHPHYEANVDTILTLPQQTGALAIANACRDTALAFLNESDRWGKPELALWLMGPYAQLIQYAAPLARRHDGRRAALTAPMLREIDVRMVERVIRSAHAEVMSTLRRISDADEGANFGFTMLAAGFVARCEDRGETAGWVPTLEARRLPDRVLSLLGVDYLTRPTDYETDLAVCAQCTSVAFDAGVRLRGICHEHGNSVLVPRGPRATIPYLHDGV